MWGPFHPPQMGTSVLALNLLFHKFFVSRGNLNFRTTLQAHVGHSFSGNSSFGSQGSHEPILVVLSPSLTIRPLISSSPRGRREGRDWHSVGCCARVTGGFQQRDLSCLGLRGAVKVTKVAVLIEKQKTLVLIGKRLVFSMRDFLFIWTINDWKKRKTE